MSVATQDFGVTTLGTVTGEEILSSVVWSPRSMDITVATGQGTLPKGTLMMLEPDDSKYYEWDGTHDIAGYLADEAVTASGDVPATLCFDAELNLDGLSAGTTISAGYTYSSGISIKEAK